MSATREMESRKKMLEENLKELSYINKQLNEDLLSLSSDPERIAIQSRNLGYIQQQEKMVFVNLAGIDSSQLDVGKILHLEGIEGSPGIAAKLMTFLILSLGLISNYIFSRKKRPVF